MEMSIDKTISELEILKKNTFSYMTANQAFTTAISTMRKYQKIEEIVNDELEDFHPLDRNPYKIALIKKVVEDGKID